MKKFLFASAFVAALFVAAPSVSASEFDNGRAAEEFVTEHRPVGLDYKSIEVSKNVHLIIEDRADGEAVITASSEILPYVYVDVMKGKLSAGIRKGVRVPKQGCVVEIAIPYSGNIESVTVSGSSKVQILPMLKASKFAANISGDSNFEARISSSKCTLKGSGNAMLDCNVKSRNLDMNMGGSSMFTGEVSINKGSLTLAGSAIVTVTGSISNAKIKAAGSAALKAARMVTDVCNVNASGSATADVMCNKTLSVKAAGTSAVRYSGKCRLSSAATAGMGKISKL